MSCIKYITFSRVAVFKSPQSNNNYSNIYLINVVNLGYANNISTINDLKAETLGNEGTDEVILRDQSLHFSNLTLIEQQ